MGKVKKICLAVGDKNVEEWLMKKLEGEAEFTTIALYTEMVLTIVRNEMPDILILQEQLPEESNVGRKMTIGLLLRKVRVHFSGCRIILIAGDRKPGDKLLKAAVSAGIYDIVYGSTIQVREVLDMVRKPRDYAYASSLLGLPDEDMQIEGGAPGGTLVDVVPGAGGKNPLSGPAVSPIGKAAQKPAPKPAQSQTPKQQPPKPASNPAPKQQPSKPAPKPAPAPKQQPNPAPKPSRNTNSGDTTILTSGGGEEEPVFSGLLFRYLDADRAGSPADTEDVPPQDWYSNPDSAEERNSASYPNNASFQPEPPSYSSENMYPVQYQNPKVLAGWDGRYFPKGALVFFGGGKEGVGTTAAALNTAYFLAKSGKRTLYIDGSYPSMMLRQFGLSEQFYTADNLSLYISQTPYAYDLFYSKRCFAEGSEQNSQFPENLFMIGRSAYPEQDGTAFIETVRPLFDFIILDAPLQPSDTLISAFAGASDRTVIVTTQDLLTINLAAEQMRTLPFPAGGPIVVVNRCETCASPSAQDIKNYFMAINTICIADDNKGFIRSAGNGVIYSSAGKRRVRQSYQDLAESLARKGG